MTDTLRISELAALTGFTSTALRYYEQVGLLQATDRTPSGYRIYDAQAVVRLKFIERGKQLGLPLTEIKELVAVWDDGLCSHVREELQVHISRKADEVQQRIRELSGFAEQLTTAHDELSGPAPEGRCGPSCGCSAATDGTAEPAPKMVVLATTRNATDPALGGSVGERSAPVACTLDRAAVGQRLADWSKLLSAATARTVIDDGVRLHFASDPDLTAELARLAVLEQTCCNFLTFTIHPAADSVMLDVRGPADALEVITQLFGAGL